MLRLLIYKTAAQMDQMDKVDVAKQLTDKVSMCQLPRQPIGMYVLVQPQFHGGIGYSRHKPFEHIPGIIAGTGSRKARRKFSCERSPVSYMGLFLEGNGQRG